MPKKSLFFPFLLHMSKILRNFAAGMRKRAEILLTTCLLLLVGTTAAMADVIKLKTGQTVEGTILFQNEEVVVIRDASGAKFQYPMSEIVQDEPLQEDQVQPEQTETPNAQKEEKPAAPQTVNTGRKVSLGISVFGGGACVPGPVVGTEQKGAWGGNAGADVMVGTSNLFQRRIFLGGATGYHAYMLNGDIYSFIPIMLRAEIPLMLTKHAPMLGMGVGYGIGLKDVKGGVCADVEFGWRYNYSRKGAFFFGIYGNFQGAELPVTEIVSDKAYTAPAYRNLCGFGAKIALFF